MDLHIIWIMCCSLFVALGSAVISVVIGLVFVIRKQYSSILTLDISAVGNYFVLQHFIH